MAQFKDREEYERWKAQRLRQASQKTDQAGPPEPLHQSPEPRIANTTPVTGLSSIGELFTASWEAYKRRFGTLIALYLTSILLLVIPLAVFLGGGMALAMLFPDAKYLLIGAGGTIGLLICCITVFWGTAGLITAVTDESLGFSSALGKGWLKVWSFIWLFSVLGFVVTGGFLLFLIPGLLFLVWFSFAQFILAEEDERGMNAMLKSKEYMQGYGGAVFLRLFIIWVVAGMLGIIPFIGPLLSILFFPFTLIYVYRIYSELRELRGTLSFSSSGGEKAKWLFVSLFGYVLVPVLLVALLGGAVLGQLFALKSIIFAPGGEFKLTPPSSEQRQTSDVVRPVNFNELIGTWIGREINRESGWTFTFSEGYNVHVVGPTGEWYRGKAGIHFDLGVTGGSVRVPPGAGILDIDITESSHGNYSGKTSLGAFSIQGGTTMKLCGGEPGKTERPESFEPSGGMRCFELTRTSGPPPAHQQPGASVPHPQSSQLTETEAREAAEAREAFKKCVTAYNAGNMDEAKEYVAKPGLAEVEESGMLGMALGMMSGLNIDEFVPSVSGNRITFKKSEKQGDMSMSMSVTMVKEDGRWKLGK